MKRVKLSDADKRSVSYSPDEVVECVRRMVEQCLRELSVTVDLIVEPCSGDARLGNAAVQGAAMANVATQSFFFDLLPATGAKHVKRLDLLSDKDMREIGKVLQNKDVLVVLNPPFNPKEKLLSVCTASLGMQGAKFAVLVLPGVYRDASKLDKLLPKFWHVQAIETLENQRFEQPLLSKESAKLMIVIVFLVRKNYLRQTALEEDDNSYQFERFKLVAADDDWDHAFQTGAIQQPVKVKKPGEDRPYGRWCFVKYLGLDSEGERERVCKMIKMRTEHATSLGNVFPVYGTTDRIAVSKEAFCDWLNLIFNGDRLYFEGLQRKKSASFASSFNSSSDSEKLSSEKSKNNHHDHISAKSIADRREVHRVSKGLDVSPDEQWCIELQEECFRRARDEIASSQRDIGKLNSAQSRALKEFVKLANSMDVDCWKKSLNNGVSLLSMIEKSGSLGRGSTLGFSIRLVMGRSFALLKIGDDGVDVSWKKKTFQRCYSVYKKVQNASNLRFAWGGYFDKLAKHGGVLKRLTARHKLDFGVAPTLETIEFDNMTKFECIPLDFLMLS